MSVDWDRGRGAAVREVAAGKSEHDQRRPIEMQRSTRGVGDGIGGLYALPASTAPQKQMLAQNLVFLEICF